MSQRQNCFPGPAAMCLCLWFHSPDRGKREEAKTSEQAGLGPQAALPDGVVGCAEVDEEVPGPVGHLQEVPHALQIRGQEAGSAPDGGHPPGGDTNIVILSGEPEHLPMQIIRALFPGEKRGCSAAQKTGRRALRPLSVPLPFYSPGLLNILGFAM